MSQKFCNILVVCEVQSAAPDALVEAVKRQTTLDCEMTSSPDTHSGWKNSLQIYSFRPT